MPGPDPCGHPYPFGTMRRRIELEPDVEHFIRELPGALRLEVLEVLRHLEELARTEPPGSSIWNVFRFPGRQQLCLYVKDCCLLFSLGPGGAKVECAARAFLAAPQQGLQE